MDDSPPLSPSNKPAPASHPPIRAPGRPQRQSTLGLAAAEGVRESERKGKEGGGFECMTGVGGQGLS